MPKYTYECEHCGELIERVNAMSEVKTKVKCTCGKMARRKWEVPNFKCVYSYMDRVQGNPRFWRGKGSRKESDR